MGRSVRRGRGDDANATIATHGDARRAVLLASVSKPVSAPRDARRRRGRGRRPGRAGRPPGSTVRHLLAHASGLPFKGLVPIAPPGRRRIYSNEGFAVLGEHVGARAEMPFSRLRARGGLRAARPRARPRRASGGGNARLSRRRSRLRPRAARAAARRARDARRDGRRAVPGARRRAPRFRALQPNGLGPRGRARHPSSVTGRARSPHRERTAISAAAARSSGSTPTGASPAWR